MELLRGTAAPIGAGPPRGGPGGPAQAAIAAYGAPPVDGRSHRRGLTSSGDGEVPRRRLLPMKRLRRTAQPSSPGLAAGGTGIPAQEALAAYGALAGGCSSLPCWLTI